MHAFSENCYVSLFLRTKQQSIDKRKHAGIDAQATGRQPTTSVPMVAAPSWPSTRLGIFSVGIVSFCVASNLGRKHAPFKNAGGLGIADEGPYRKSQRFLFWNRGHYTAVALCDRRCHT